MDISASINLMYDMAAVFTVAALFLGVILVGLISVSTIARARHQRVKTMQMREETYLYLSRIRIARFVVLGLLAISLLAVATFSSIDLSEFVNGYGSSFGGPYPMDTSFYFTWLIVDWVIFAITAMLFIIQWLAIPWKQYGDTPMGRQDEAEGEIDHLRREAQLTDEDNARLIAGLKEENRHLREELESYYPEGE